MAGREWRPRGEPVQVEDHSFFSDGPDVAQAIPYGIYDMTRNTGWVNVGVDHDTSMFAVDPSSAGGQSRPSGLPDSVAVADHRGCGRLQRLLLPGVEKRAGGPGRRDRPGHHRLSLLAGNFEVEQDRAPVVFPYHPQLAWPAVDQPRSRHRNHCLGPHQHRPARGGPPSTTATIRSVCRSAGSASPHCRCSLTRPRNLELGFTFCRHGAGPPERHQRPQIEVTLEPGVGDVVASTIAGDNGTFGCGCPTTCGDC